MKKRNVIYKTSQLLPKNNFLVGIGSVLNLAGSYFDYNYSDSESEADYKAINSDWKQTGNDLRNAKRDFEEKNRKKLLLK